MKARIGYVIHGLASRPLLSVVQLYAGYAVEFFKHCVTVRHNVRLVPKGAKDLNSNLWMIQISKEKPSAISGSPISVMFESGNHVVPDPWKDIRDNAHNFNPNEQLLGNIVHKSNEQVIANIVQTSTEPDLAKYHHQSLAPTRINNNEGIITPSRQITNFSRHGEHFDPYTSSTINVNLPRAYGQEAN